MIPGSGERRHNRCETGLIFRGFHVKLHFRHRCPWRVVETHPRRNDLRVDGRLDCPCIGFEDVLSHGALRVSVAHPGGIRGRCELTDQERVDGSPGEFQDAEIHVVAASVGGVQELDFGVFGEDAAAVGTEGADQVVQDGALAVPCVLIHLGDHEGHPEALDEGKQVLDRPVLEDMQPGEDPDFALSRRVRLRAELVEDKTVWLLGHAERTVGRDQTWDDAVPKREMPGIDRTEAEKTAAFSPEDLRGGERLDHGIRHRGHEVVEGAAVAFRPGFFQLGLKALGGLFRDRRIIAGDHGPGRASKGVGALFKRGDHVPVSLHNLTAGNAEVFDIAGVGSADDAAQLIGRVFAGVRVPRPCFCHLSGIKAARRFGFHDGLFSEGT